MKIAIVCFNLKWQAGGARLIFSLAQILKKNGNKVVIYTPEFRNDVFPELCSGLDIEVVPPKYPFEWTKNPVNIFEKIIHKIRQERLHIDTAQRIAEFMDKDFEIVNLHDFAYKAGFFYKKINPAAKIVWTENDPPYLYLPKENLLFDILSRLFNVWKIFCARKYFKAIDIVAVLDFYNRDWAKKHGLNPVVVRSGVDFDKFYWPVKNYKEPKKSMLILGIGALNKYRRFEDIVYAVKYLRSWDYDAKAIIVCKDIWDEREYRQKLIEITDQEGMDEYVNFNFEGVSESELRQVYRKSDVFVLPLYLPPPRNGYGWGLTNFEAMAAGLPLVICRTSTATEVLVDQKQALFVEPMSPEDIAKKIKVLMDDPSLYRRIAEAGQQFVKENISWEKYTREMLRIFEK